MPRSLTQEWFVMSEQEQLQTADQKQFFVVSLRKVAVVSFFTFGWYWLYCFYRSWVLQRKYAGARVLPILRALFAVFFIYALLKRVDNKLRQSGCMYRWSPFALTVGLIVTAVLPFYVTHGIVNPNLPVVIFLQVLLAAMNTWCVVSMQKAINSSEGDVSGKVNSNFTVANWLWMACGLLVWPSMVMLALLAFLMGIDLGTI